MTYRKPTTEELNALKKWRDKYGREWKSYLRAAWLSAYYRGSYMGGTDTGTLRNIRNEFGSTWLDKFQFPKES